jgi:hypothetical protein
MNDQKEILSGYLRDLSLDPDNQAETHRAEKLLRQLEKGKGKQVTADPPTVKSPPSETGSADGWSVVESAPGKSPIDDGWSLEGWSDDESLAGRSPPRKSPPRKSPPRKSPPRKSPSRKSPPRGSPPDIVDQTAVLIGYLHDLPAGPDTQEETVRVEELLYGLEREIHRLYLGPSTGPVEPFRPLNIFETRRFDVTGDIPPELLLTYHCRGPHRPLGNCEDTCTLAASWNDCHDWKRAKLKHTIDSLSTQ